MLKLGGSLITHKDRPNVARKRAIRSIADLLAKKVYTEKRMIIVHGGGSFGHYEASLDISLHGRLTYIGFPRISSAMVTLNEIMLKQFIRAGLPSVSLPPRAFCLFECESKTVKCNYDVVGRYVEKGIIPVLFGDILLGKGECGPYIISGDDIIVDLAREYGPAKVIFAMDIDGIYRPTSTGRLGELIRKLDIDNVIPLIEEIERAGKAQGYDVTGGIIYKLKKSLECIQRGYCTEVIFVSGEKRDRLYNAIIGKPDTYTLMKR